MIQRLASIVTSFLSLPLWVRLWVALWLVPVNMISPFFLAEPMGTWVAVLAIGGMLPNMVIAYREAGLSKLMALPHLVPWTILVLWMLFAMPKGSGSYEVYVLVLAATNAISLAFDYRDSWKWWRGDRAVAGAGRHAQGASHIAE